MRREKSATLLSALQAAVDAVDARSALEALLVAWRECPATELAELIERRGATAAAEHPPLAGKTLEARQATWLAAAAERDVTRLDRLIESLFERTIKPTVARVEALRAWGADPRLGRVVMRWREQDTFSSAQYFWTAMLELAQSSGDPRVVRSLKPPAGREVHPDWASTMTDWERVYEQLAARFPSPPELPPEAAALVAKLAAKLGAKPVDGPALLAAIYENPDDDSLRQIYGDWLTEQGDPRGEFIALQFAKLRDQPSAAAQKRERELLDEHGRRWLGALAPQVKAGAVFERGFAARVELKGLSTACPEWSTVTELVDERDLGLPVGQSWYPPLPALRRAAVSERRLTDLVAAAPRLVGVIGLRGNAKQLVAQLPQQSSIREIGIDGSENLAALWQLAAETPALATLRLFLRRSVWWQGQAGWVVSFVRDGELGLLIERLPDDNALVNDAAMPALFAELPKAARASARFGRWEGAPLDADTDAALRALFPTLPANGAPEKKRPRKQLAPEVAFPKLLKAIKERKTSTVADLLAAGAPTEFENRQALVETLGARGFQLGKDNALAIQRLLLDAGANPNARAFDKLLLTWAYAVFESHEFSPEAAALLVERGARADNETVTYCIIGNSDDNVELLRDVLARLDGPLDKKAALATAKEHKRKKLAAFLSAL